MGVEAGLLECQGLLGISQTVDSSREDFRLGGFDLNDDLDDWRGNLFFINDAFTRLLFDPKMPFVKNAVSMKDVDAAMAMVFGEETSPGAICGYNAFIWLVFETTTSTTLLISARPKKLFSSVA
jgi:hypothetical protein